MVFTVDRQAKEIGTLVEYLDGQRLRTALVVGEQDGQLRVREHGLGDKLIARELVVLRHREKLDDPAKLAEVVAALKQERARLAAEFEVDLLWEVVEEQGRAFGVEELAGIFFGTASTAACAVVFELLLSDRVYFVRRHLEFRARSREQVERLKLQEQRVRLRSEEGRRKGELLRAALAGEPLPPNDENLAALAAALHRYLENPFSRNSELTALLSQAMPEVDPAELAFEVLDRLGVPPPGPRFAVIRGLKTQFDAEAELEAATVVPGPRPPLDAALAVTIDDDETLEVDDALSLEPLDGGRMRVRVLIALVADFVARDGAMDRQALARATSVYLPETTIRMLPEEVSCNRASLRAGAERPVLVTEVVLEPDGAIAQCAVYPARISVGARLSYDRADLLLAGADPGDDLTRMLKRLAQTAATLRARRQQAGATAVSRREPKVRVVEGRVEVTIIDPASPSRTLVAEMMVLSNFVAAHFATEQKLPLIYRTQPAAGREAAPMRARLSLYPEPHAGLGLPCYTQVSSPIRRYADLAVQRQLLCALGAAGSRLYRSEELLAMIATAEAAEAEAKELERRARRYWILRRLEQEPADRPMPAIVTRDGVGAELEAFAVRGALVGAPNVTAGTPVLVRLARIDPLRGTLTLEYRQTLSPGACGQRR